MTLISTRATKPNARSALNCIQGKIEPKTLNIIVNMIEVGEIDKPPKMYASTEKTIAINTRLITL